jgi:hypothetical protein
MRNQTKYFILYLCILCALIGTATQLAQAQDTSQNIGASDNEFLPEVLNQAELDQMLAPIALYPDTLLSHVLVASTYPLEVVQAARWRSENEDLDEQQALDAVEDKDWDPSVKALVPFNDLLQKLSEDLEWLQSLGDAFLANEEQVLTSVQSLRKKAYSEGNLEDNEYLSVEQDEGEILIQTVDREVVYVPYYDTRVVYGDWSWGAYPPHYWHWPSHYVWNAGFYWSPRFYIRPSFYFGGFHWHNRHVVVDYHYRNSAHRSWRHHNNYNRQQTVRVREYPRWSHNQHHRRGVRYQHNQNPNRYVSVNVKHHSKKQHQIDKQRVLNVDRLKNKRTGQDVKQRLHNIQAKAQNNKRHERSVNQPLNRKKAVLGENHKQSLINKANREQRSRVVGKDMVSKNTAKKGVSNNHKRDSYPKQQTSNTKSQEQKVYRSDKSRPTSTSSKRSSGHNKYQRQTSSNTNKSRNVSRTEGGQKKSRH